MASAEGSAAVSEASSQPMSQSKGTGVALVTGANKGIGKEIARGLVKSGRYGVQLAIVASVRAPLTHGCVAHRTSDTWLS